MEGSCQERGGIHLDYKGLLLAEEAAVLLASGVCLQCLQKLCVEFLDLLLELAQLLSVEELAVLSEQPTVILLNLREVLRILGVEQSLVGHATQDEVNGFGFVLHDRVLGFEVGVHRGPHLWLLLRSPCHPLRKLEFTSWAIDRVQILVFVLYGLYERQNSTRIFCLLFHKNLAVRLLHGLLSLGSSLCFHLASQEWIQLGNKYGAHNLAVRKAGHELPESHVAIVLQVVV